MDECIRKYDLKGNILQTIHLKEKVDGYRYSFLCLNDSLFVMSQNNEGNNPNELFFINGKGSIIERKANINQFQASENHISTTWIGADPYSEDRMDVITTVIIVTPFGKYTMI